MHFPALTVKVIILKSHLNVGQYFYYVRLNKSHEIVMLEFICIMINAPKDKLEFNILFKVSLLPRITFIF